MHKLYASLRGIKLHNFFGGSRYYVYSDGDDTCFSNVLLWDGDGKNYSYDFSHESSYQDVAFCLETFDIDEEEI
jgi:hypothetical protein